MPNVPLKSLTYGDDQRKLTDVINENFNLLWWLLNNNNLGASNLAPIEQLIIQETELASAVDGYGINPEFLKFHSNKVYNSSFELCSSAFDPYYWDTEGVSSPDSNFDNTYSLKLTTGQTAIQVEENSIGVWDTSWWSWASSSRISFRVKGTDGGKVKIEVLDSSNTAQPLKRWVYNSDKKTYTEVATATGSHYIEFDVYNNWPNSFRCCAVTPVTAGEMRIKFTNSGSTDIYIDAVTVEPDWNGRWPSFYSHGPRSVQNDRVFIQSSEPSNPILDDIWIDTTSA
jgi:hypothetical protein